MSESMGSKKGHRTACVFVRGVGEEATYGNREEAQLREPGSYHRMARKCSVTYKESENDPLGNTSFLEDT